MNTDRLQSHHPSPGDSRAFFPTSSQSSIEVPEATELSVSSSENNSLEGEKAVGEDSKEQDDHIVESSSSSREHFDPVAKVIGSMNLMDIVACPCCHMTLDDQQYYRINEPERLYQHRESLLSHSDSEDEDLDSRRRALVEASDGVLDEPSRAHYRLNRILAEGWLHKKGSGKDWLGTTSWKARWARLAMASVEGFSVDVPVLLIYWHPLTTTASTAIALHSTVVLAEDEGNDQEAWDAHRFVIKYKNGTSRVFSAQQKDRDDWVYTISQALLQYEKQKASLKKLHRPTSPVQNSKDPWKNLYAVEIRSPTKGNSSHSLSPPVSPRAPTSRPLLPRLPRRPSDGSHGISTLKVMASS